MLIPKKRQKTKMQKNKLASKKIIPFEITLKMIGFLKDSSPNHLELVLPNLKYPKKVKVSFKEIEDDS